MRFEAYRIKDGELFGDRTITAISWDDAERQADDMNMGLWINGRIVKEIDEQTGEVLYCERAEQN